ncbi:MAG TPA: glycoside hydrolase family 9 protein [Gemmatimonadaceae bacterium]|nr:glycoside hydrolase family 9 protein [Gemmatimonadaceae bacterium]
MITTRRWYHAAFIAPLVSLCAMVALGGCHAGGIPSGAPHAATDSATSFIRVNQVGYLPSGRKVAVVCSLAPAKIGSFEVVDGAGKRVFGPAPATRERAFGPCTETYRLDFSALTTEGDYHITASGLASRTFTIAANAYAGAADTLLYYMRQQRSGYNPVFRDSVHTHDGIIVDDSARAGQYIAASGGWADASDYLQYVTTSATATFQMMLAYREHPDAFGDAFAANGLPGANGIPDVLDEARHGLEWLTLLFPGDGNVYNQVADDRDHQFWDLPATDSVDYGWGKGGARPVYPCTGRPQGLFKHKNRSDGLASTAGKYASAFALGSQLLEDRDPEFARLLAERARQAYEIGREHPGVCQTAPGTAPYFYEEDNWTDDMELGAAELFSLTGDSSYIRQAIEYAAREPVTPWMGADTAKHYQWFPWYNAGHYEIWRNGDASAKRMMADYYRRGIERVAARADNGFRIGIPFIWCSNNLMTSFATQAHLYRMMTGDDRYLEYETAALDWLFGVNPWGVSMVVGLPAGGVTAQDPHSVVADKLGVDKIMGGLLDGPVYRSIFQNLKGISLHDADEYAPFNTGFIVYHDDIGDYSTNEPIMDGTANLTYLLGAMSGGGREGRQQKAHSRKQ